MSKDLEWAINEIDLLNGEVEEARNIARRMMKERDEALQKLSNSQDRNIQLREELDTMKEKLYIEFDIADEFAQIILNLKDELAEAHQKVSDTRRRNSDLAFKIDKLYARIRELERILHVPHDVSD